jgi:hypothetical protein
MILDFEALNGQAMSVVRGHALKLSLDHAYVSMAAWAGHTAASPL